MLLLLSSVVLLNYASSVEYCGPCCLIANGGTEALRIHKEDSSSYNISEPNYKSVLDINREGDNINIENTITACGVHVQQIISEVFKMNLKTKEKQCYLRYFKKISKSIQKANLQYGYRRVPEEACMIDLKNNNFTAFIKYKINNLFAQNKNTSATFTNLNMTVTGKPISSDEMRQIFQREVEKLLENRTNDIATYTRKATTKRSTTLMPTTRGITANVTEMSNKSEEEVTKNTNTTKVTTTELIPETSTSNRSLNRNTTRKIQPIHLPGSNGLQLSGIQKYRMNLPKTLPCLKKIPKDLCQPSLEHKLVVSSYKRGRKTLQCNREYSASYLKKRPKIMFFGEIKNSLMMQMKLYKKGFHLACPPEHFTYTGILASREKISYLYWMTIDVNACRILIAHQDPLKELKGGEYQPPGKFGKSKEVMFLLYRQTAATVYNNSSIQDRTKFDVYEFAKKHYLCGPLATKLIKIKF